MQRQGDHLRRTDAAVMVEVGDLLDAHGDLLVDSDLPDLGQVDLFGGLLGPVAEFEERFIVTVDDAGGIQDAVGGQLGLLVTAKREGDTRRRPVDVAKDGRSLVQSRDHDLIRFHHSSLQRMRTGR